MKIAVLVSGGVDSTVALYLLKEQGHDVTAFYLKIWLEDELSYLGQACPWEEDLSYVRAVCEKLTVKLEIISLQKEYWDHVVTYTINQIKLGYTPNPDMLCNKAIKFGFFLDKIDASFEKVATGHYAQVEEKDGMFYLKMAPDPIKDQTYFLAQLTQQQLSRILFPIGHLHKSEVRELAHSVNMPNKDRKDSQGICFLGKLKFSEFIAHYLGQHPGDIIEFETDKKIGTHKGFWYHTIGQRQGSGLAGGPWYVVQKDVKNNRVYMSRNYFSPDKMRDSFAITQCNWINDVPKSNALKVKIRHGKNVYDCLLSLKDRSSAEIKLAQNDQGIAAGQFAVLYENEYCLGSGVMC